MSFDTSQFWRKVATVRELAMQGKHNAAMAALGSLRALARNDETERKGARQHLIDQISEAYGLSAPQQSLLKSSRDANGVSLVTACRNRNENLKLALKTWLACSEIREIIIVDWSSDTAVADDLEWNDIHDPRISIVRVENEARWVLSYAFNLGFQYARYPTLLKADADILIEPDFFQRNQLNTAAYIAGNWRTAESDQGFVNGFFLIDRQALLNIGGFNEFILTYGWDDEDLYGRLAGCGLARDDVVSGSIRHIDHGDGLRVGRVQTEPNQTASRTLTSDPGFLIRRNRHVANIMPAWSRSRRLATYTNLEEGPGFTRVRRNIGVGETVPDAVLEEANLVAARELMAWKLGEECLRLSLKQVEQLISNNAWEQLSPEMVVTALGERCGDGSPPGAARHHRARLFVDAQHGLGNRLRAVGSAAAIAKAEERELVIVWTPDEHCSCRFQDLFNYEGPVFDSRDDADVARRNSDVFNYMEVELGARKDEPVVSRPTRDLYLRSAFVLRHPASSWDHENRFIKNLEPVQRVQDLVASVDPRFDIGAHVRMVGGAGYEHLAWESSKNWNRESHDAINHWRQLTQPERFMARLEAIWDAQEPASLFLAADAPEVYTKFSARFGSRVQFLMRTINDRSLEQMHYALADAILLSRSRILLGSTWSSFSELASRLAGEGQVVEMAGRDF